MTQLYVENLNDDLENVSTRMSANHLTLNHFKTEYMIIDSNKKVIKLICNPKYIFVVDQ